MSVVPRSLLGWTQLTLFSAPRALHLLSIADSKTEPDLSPVRVIRLADIIMNLWQRYIATALVPLAGTSVTVRREMGIFNNHITVRIEGKINAIAQRTTDGERGVQPSHRRALTSRPTAVLSWVATLLAKQKKLDFKPRNDNEAFSKINTEPCVAVCDFVAKVKDAASESLSGRNQEVFLTEVGVTFHS